MDAHRRARFAALLEGPKFRGDRDLFRRKSGLSKGRITQLLDKDQPFGELAGKRLAIRLGLRESYFEMAPQLESPEPAPAPTLEAAVGVIGDYLADVDKDTRESVGRLLDGLASNPQNAERVGRQIRAVVESGKPLSEAA